MSTARQDAFPLITVIVPAYNSVETLSRCVQSALAQSYPNIEVVIVDDGSSDGTSVLADSLADPEPRLRVLHQANKGLSGARNTSLGAADGDYIFFLDSDDYIAEDELVTLYDALVSTAADMAVGGFVCVDQAASVLGRVGAPAGTVDERGYWALAYGDSPGDYLEYVVSWGKLLPRAAFRDERFDEGKLSEDEFIIHRLVSRCARVAIVDCSGYFYVQRTGSIMHTRGERAYLDAAEAMLARCAYFQDRGWGRFAWRSLAQARWEFTEALALGPSGHERARYDAMLEGWRGLYRSLFRAGGARPMRAFAICSLFFVSPGAFVWLKARGRPR